MLEDEKQRLDRFESRLKQGFLRLIVLHLLEQGKAKNGYELMRTIKEETGGRWEPKANRIYPILKEFEMAGWVNITDAYQGDRKRKKITMTKVGKLAAEERIRITRAVLEPWLNLIIDGKNINHKD
ncbi:MAG: PadR family transcriptional regulator [Candidatus Hodarchaeales archaeon]